MIMFCMLCIVFPVHAQDDMVKFVEDKRIELKIREDALKKEEERLNILRKDVDEKIEKYTKLLNRVDVALKKQNKFKISDCLTLLSCMKQWLRKLQLVSFPQWTPIWRHRYFLE